jgi:hypothetical protein
VVTGPGFFVYLAGGIKRDDAKIKAVAEATGLSAYEAKIMLGAPGPRKIAAFAKEEDALGVAAPLRQAGLVAFVVDKDRFSRAPKIFKALSSKEDPTGFVFTIETAPAPGEIQVQSFELPQPKGLVRAVLLGYYTQTTTHSDGGKSKASTTSKSQVREPFVHLYSEDPHTILEIAGPRYVSPWHRDLAGIFGEMRWLQLAERFAAYYQAKLDTTLFKYPDEVGAVTAALNVDAAHGQASRGATGSSASSDDSPLAMAASRIIVYSLVFGV